LKPAANRLADPKGGVEGRLLLRRTGRHARSWKEIGMQRSPRQVGLTAVTVLTMAIALTIVTGPAAVAEPPLSCAEDIPAYLVGIGVNPDDAANAICQEGLRNYAGPSCPGTGWNCVRANVPIVQIANLGGTNLFYCTALNCLVIQVVHGGPGQNASACERRVDNPTTGETVMVCDIMQVNGGPGTNAATISQHIQQTKGTMQKAREIARITQTNETKSNIARIIQGIGQTQNAKGGGSITQSQEAHQAATVDQLTTSGANTSNIDQRQNQSQRAAGSSGLVTQKQNTDPGFDSSCDRPTDNPDFDQEKNQCAEVTQDSSVVPSTGGSIQSRLNQAITESQTASNAGSVDQDQGTFPGGPLTPGGQDGIVVQNSSAPVDSDAIQDTNQTQIATGIIDGVDPGDQFKNTGDPRCCATQTINPGSTADITQRTNQSAFVNGEYSDDAEQFASLRGDCDSFGTCTVEQLATVNGDPTPNGPCTGNVCHIFIECVSAGGGEGTFCVASEDGS
jgi:hypothetical protein